MAWIELHQSAPTHRKTLAVADVLGVPPVYALGHLSALWLWSVDNAPDGSLRGISPRVVAYAAQWPGEPSEFVSALVTVGFLDETEESGLAIHDWDEYAGKLLERKARNAEQMRESRRIQGLIKEDTRVQHVDTRVKLPDLTLPDLTGDTSTSAEVEAGTAVPASLHDFEYFSKELRNDKANRPAILCLAISDVFGLDCREFGRVGRLAGSSAGEMLKKIYKFRPDWNGVDNPVDYLTIQINGGHVGNGRPNAMKAPPRASPTASDLAISRADDLVRRESLRREGVPSIYSSEPPAFNPLGSGD